MEHTMYARLTRFQADISRRDEALAKTDDEILADMHNEPGFKHMYVLVDPETGDGTVITLWDSKETEEASRASVAQRFAVLADLMTAPPQPSEALEVLLEG